jgi:cyanophycinase
MSVDITLTNDLFHLPYMSNILTDTHFFQRDRMGRLVTFLARVVKNKWIHPSFDDAMGIGVSEHTGVLIDHTSGNCTLTGDGPVYFVRSNPYIERCDEDHSLTYQHLVVHKWNGSSSSTFSFKDWQFFNDGWIQYKISAVSGLLKSTQKDGSIY